MKKTVKRIWNSVTTVLILLLVILAALLWGPRLLNMQVLVVQSGSMEPAYHVGSLVYVKPVEASRLQVGDTITFRMADGIRGTHRIVEVLQQDGQLSFRTKGDSNPQPDPTPVAREDVVGKVVFTVPRLGYLVTYIQQPPGMYVAISVAAMLFLLTVLPDLLFPEDKSKKNGSVSS